MAEETQNIHKSIRTIVLVANVLGLLPVNGVTSDSVENLNFRWFCPKTIYTYTLMSIALLETVTSAVVLFQCGISSAGFLLFTVPLIWLLILIAYLHLARKWSHLVKKWIKLEVEMRRTYKYPLNLDGTFTRLTGLFMAGSAVIYVKVVFTRYQEYALLSTGPKLYGLKVLSILNVNSSPNATKFSIISEVSLIIVSYAAWTVNTLLVIAISTAVALRFRQITARLRKYGMQTHSLVFWCGIRTDYIRLCQLCRLINEHISMQITIGFACNFWFAIIHVFRIVSSKEKNESNPSYMHLALHMVHILCIGLYTAWVNDESKKPLEILNSVPSINYNNAIKMFVDHISFDTVALCGYKVFRCTKGLLLTIAGALVTYEVLLIQITAYISR